MMMTLIVDRAAQLNAMLHVTHRGEPLI